MAESISGMSAFQIADFFLGTGTDFRGDNLPVPWGRCITPQQEVDA